MYKSRLQFTWNIHSPFILHAFIRYQGITRSKYTTSWKSVKNCYFNMQSFSLSCFHLLLEVSTSLQFARMYNFYVSNYGPITSTISLLHFRYNGTWQSSLWGQVSDYVPTDIINPLLQTFVPSRRRLHSNVQEKLWSL